MISSAIAFVQAVSFVLRPRADAASVNVRAGFMSERATLFVFGSTYSGGSVGSLVALMDVSADKEAYNAALDIS